MQFIRLLTAFGVLFGISFFIASNTRVLTEGSGYAFLVVAVASFGVLILVSRDLFSLILLKKSTVALLIFLLWFVGKYTFESTNPLETREVTIGTTGGIIFALILGFISSYALSTIYSLRQFKVASAVALLLGLGFIVFVVVTSLDTFRLHYENVSGDQFLIEDNRGLYQRVGDLLFIQNMIVVSLAMVLLATRKNVVFLLSIGVTALVVGLAGITGATAQVVGSNSGLATAVVFALVYLICYMAIGLKHSDSSRVNISNMLFGTLGLKLLTGMLVSLAVVGLVAFGVINILNVDISTLRFLGYGEGRVTSLDSRNELFVDNFMTHFSYSPIFGHTQVDKLTTGSGTYAHSLLSILPHLGLIGFVLFAALLIMMYKEVTAINRNQYDSIYTNKQYSLFRLLGLASVVFMCGISAYYIWMPLWFAIGLYGNWFYQVAEVNAIKRSGRRRRRSRRSSNSVA